MSQSEIEISSKHGEMDGNCEEQWSDVVLAITDLFTSNLESPNLSSGLAGVSTLWVEKHAWKWCSSSVSPVFTLRVEMHSSIWWSSNLAPVSTLGVERHASIW
jgi:hypothetical protein